MRFFRNLWCMISGFVGMLNALMEALNQEMKKVEEDSIEYRNRELKKLETLRSSSVQERKDNSSGGEREIN